MIDVELTLGGVPEEVTQAPWYPPLRSQGMLISLRSFNPLENGIEGRPARV